MRGKDVLVFASRCGLVGVADADTVVKMLKNGTEIPQDTSTGLIQLKVLSDGGRVQHVLYSEGDGILTVRTEQGVQVGLSLQRAIKDIHLFTVDDVCGQEFVSQDAWLSKCFGLSAGVDSKWVVSGVVLEELGGANLKVYE